MITVPYEVSASAALTEIDTRILKQDETFGIFDRLGNIYPVGNDELGIYFQGTRFLSDYEFTIGEGFDLLLLNSTLRDDSGLLKVELTNPDMRTPAQERLPRGQLYIQRDKFLLSSGCGERFYVHNYSAAPITLDACLHYGADYRDIFEIRGMRRPARGVYNASILRDREIELSYRGLDGRLRRTTIEFSFTPTQVSPERICFRLEVPPQGLTTFLVRATFSLGEETPRLAPLDLADAERFVSRSHASGRAHFADVHASSEAFQRWHDRSRDDLVMMTTNTPHGAYPYAGIPWYACPFGRDGIWTALLCLWANPRMAEGVLHVLGATQALAHDEEADAEPGKIVHEIREGEMAALKEIPFGRYYGSVDSTPLFLMLAGAYYRRTGDLETIRSLWPKLEAALAWVENHGDVDGDGFVEYQTHSHRGLRHQGWKDSIDPIFHADGNEPEGPIALAEVQAYTYAARMAMAQLAERLELPGLAKRQRAEADRLRERFDQAFWLADLGTYALALDGAKRPCRVRTSNAGHALYTGIALPEREETLARTLLSEDLFSGWGVRTVGTGEKRYNPMSYHNGSVWPHDTAIIALGLSRAGRKAEVEVLFEALFRASRCAELARLPEVYCGFSAREGDPPTLYPVACSPQAWSSAAIYGLLQAALGLDLEAETKTVRFLQPCLPKSLGTLHISDIAFGGGKLGFVITPQPGDVGIHVERMGTEATVAVEK